MGAGRSSPWASELLSVALCHRNSSDFWAQTLKKCDSVCNRHRTCLWRPSSQPSVPVSSCAEWAPPPWGFSWGFMGGPLWVIVFQSILGCADLSVREPAPNLALVPLPVAEMQMVLETGCPVSLVCQGRPESFSRTWGLGVSSCGPARRGLGVPLRGAGRVALAVVRTALAPSTGTSRSAQRSRRRRAAMGLV